MRWYDGIGWVRLGEENVTHVQLCLGWYDVRSISPFQWLCRSKNSTGLSFAETIVSNFSLRQNVWSEA